MFGSAPIVDVKMFGGKKNNVVMSETDVMTKKKKTT